MCSCNYILTQKDLPSLLASLTNSRTKDIELCINAVIGNIKKKLHTHKALPNLLSEWSNTKKLEVQVKYLKN